MAGSERASRLWLAMLGGVLACGLAWGGTADRIHSRIENNATIELTGSAHPLATPDTDEGSVDPSFRLTPIRIFFKPTTSQQQELARLLQQQQDSSSPLYHKWLTPDQFGDRFGLSARDVEKISTWLEEAGLEHVQATRSRTSISLTGTAEQVQRAFQVSLHHYRLGGKRHFASATTPLLPRSLNGIVLAISGLDDFYPTSNISQISKTVQAGAAFNLGSGGKAISPDDYATIYDLKALYQAGLDGTGQKIAVVGQSDIDPANIAAFRSAAGLPVNVPQVILDGDDPGSSTTGDQVEADLDIEWAGAVARGATILYVNSSNVFESIHYAIENNVAPVITVSYGTCEQNMPVAVANAFDASLKQANVQGITIVAASGDSGAAGCDRNQSLVANGGVAVRGLAVAIPSSSSAVTSVGGTVFTESGVNYWSALNDSNHGSAVSYIPEAAWNDSWSGTPTATGGGRSIYFAKPSWQQGRNVPIDGMRDTPDIAMAAAPSHDGLLVCLQNGCVNGFADANRYVYMVGGTSAAAPPIAGLVAILNQMTGSAQGNINPKLYALAAASSDAFHDIVNGNNEMKCAETPDCIAGLLGYQTGPGYDQATGLGSVDGYNLVEEWAPSFQIAASPGALTVAAGASATATIQIVPVGKFAGVVTFSCSVPATLPDTTCSIPATAAGASGAMLTITNSYSKNAQFVPRFGNGTGRRRSLGVLAIAFTMLLSIVVYKGRQPRVAWRGLALLSLVAIVSCGGGSSSGVARSQVVEPTVTGTVTITAISAGTALSAAITRTTTIAVTEP